MSLESLQLVFAPLQRPDRSGKPKYVRVADTLVDAIRQGVWRPGDRLPAEEELTQLTPYSLGTVQKALKTLVDQGLVKRQHGLGSFVAAPSRELQDPWHCRFLMADEETVLPVYSQAVQRIEIQGVGPWTKYLGTDAQVMQLDRVIDVNDEFKIYSCFYADRLRLAKLWEMPMSELNGANFKQLIINECKLPITEITHLVRIRRFDSEVCKQISQPKGAAGIFMQAIARAGRDLCVYYQEFYIGPTDHSLKFPEATLSFN